MFQHRRHAVVCASHQEVTQGEVPMLRSNEPSDQVRAEKRVKILYLTKIVSMYAKGYYNVKIKLITDEEAFKILKVESFNSLMRRKQLDI